MKKGLMYPMLMLASLIFMQACKNENSPKENTAATKVVEDTFKDSAALAMLQVLVEKELAIPVSLKSTFFKADSNTAFVSATILKKDGSKMDFKGTPFDEQANIGGSFSDGVFGLLKKENGTWKVKGISVGATDVPFVCWPSMYNVSKSIFPEGMGASDCGDNTPFIFLSNTGHLSLNGGINITSEELKEQLIELLVTKDSIPNDITPEFGDEIIGGSRSEIKTIIQEAIDEAKKGKK
jgi:hypothetical protein